MTRLLNTRRLVEDTLRRHGLAAAVDLALLFAVTQPGPAPYVIVEVWRRVAPDAKAID